MKEILIIPNYADLKTSLELIEEFDAGFEYHDFYLPNVYDDVIEENARIAKYKEVRKDRSKDTLHGAFLDIAPSSKDKVIKKRSYELMLHSMDVAAKLGVKGVVFHSGLVPNVENDEYIGNWLNVFEDVICSLNGKYPELDIYLENTTERTPDALIKLKERMKDIERFGLCLDYGHAALSPTSNEEWVSVMAPYVRHMHLNDNDLKADLHMVPGEGMIDYKEMFSLLNIYNIDTSCLLELTGNEAQRKALTWVRNNR